MMQWCSSGSKLCCRVLVTALKRLLYKIDVVSLAAADWWPAFWNFVSNMFRCEIWTDGQDDSDWKQDVAHLNSALVLRNPPTPQRPNFMCLRSVKLLLCLGKEAVIFFEITEPCWARSYCCCNIYHIAHVLLWILAPEQDPKKTGLLL